MKLSIITINLNNLRGLQRTMESIVAQTSKDYEWIVIDGGSSDGSKELIEQNAEYIAYWVSEKDNGLYHAMNKGVYRSSGDYLIFLNSGDSFASPDIVESFMELTPLTDVIYGDAYFINQEDVIVGKMEMPEKVRLSLFWNRWFNHQGTFFNRRCFEFYKYNERNRIFSDRELLMQLLYHGFTFLHWNKYVDCFEVGGRSSIVSSDDVIEFDAIVNRVLPPGVKADYDEIIQMRDVDLYIMMRRIVNSPRWVRNLARISLLPFNLFLRRR